MHGNSLQGASTPIAPPKLKFTVPTDSTAAAANDIEGRSYVETNTIANQVTEDDQTSSPAATQTKVNEIAQVEEKNQVVAATSFAIDTARPLDPNTFPNLSIKGKPLSTIANVLHLLKSYGITARYNVIEKKLLVTVPGLSSGPDNFDNVVMSHLFSLAALNRMSTGQLPSFVAAIGDKHQFNPVATWITSKPWDCIDRFQAFCDTLIHRQDYPVELKKILLKRWMVSAVAAIFKPIGFKARGVLTLQGCQSIGKTAWFSELVPDLVLRESVLKVDVHLDPSNKDSVMTAVSRWLIELGELESSFRKDIARIKGFLTSDQDKLRRPYGRTDSVYPRRTVFVATVNESAFLVDSTGNTRWWTISVTSVNYTHGIDMQQLWAQMTIDFHAGEQWWLTKEEEALLEKQNKEHRSMSVIAERVLGAIDLKRVNEPNLPAMSPSELLIKIDIKNPTNTQFKECATVLREHIGESKRINGINKWRVPLAQFTYSASLSPSASPSKPINDDDLY